jgi:hypothetical protein
MDDLFLTRMLAMECREDAVTEVFASLLEVAPLRTAFLRHVLEADEIAELPLRVDRQYENRNARGIPDVALHGDGVFVLIENKLGAPLTPNQPCEYFEEVRRWKADARGGHGYLVIQAPEKRLGVLSAKCTELLKAKCAEYLEDVPVKCISWERTARAFQEVTLADPVAAFARNNFTKLVSDVASRASAPLTKGDIMLLRDRAVLDALCNLQRLMADLRARADREEAYETKVWWDFADVSIEVWPRGDKSRHVYIVCSYDAALRVGGGPLWLQLSGDAFRSAGMKSRLAAAGHQLHAPQPDWVEGAITPLELVADLDPPEQVERLWQAVVRIVGTVEPVVASTPDVGPAGPAT